MVMVVKDIIEMTDQNRPSPDGAYVFNNPFATRVLVGRELGIDVMAALAEYERERGERPNTEMLVQDPVTDVQMMTPSVAVHAALGMHFLLDVAESMEGDERTYEIVRQRRARQADALTYAALQALEFSRPEVRVMELPQDLELTA